MGSSVVEVTTETTVVSTTVDGEADTPSPEPDVVVKKEFDFMDFLDDEQEIDFDDDEQEVDFNDFLSEEPSTSKIEITTETTVVTATVDEEADTPSPEVLGEGKGFLSVDPYFSS